MANRGEAALLLQRFGDIDFPAIFEDGLHLFNRVEVLLYGLVATRVLAGRPGR